MPRKTTKHHVQNRSRLLRANVWSIRTLWHSMLKGVYRSILVLLGLGLLGGAVWGGMAALDRLFYDNQDFRLQVIQLNPNKAINERDLVAITGLELDCNIFRIEIKEVTRRLLSQPAIKDARVQRQTPGTLIVNVTTRTPRAWLACPDDGIPAAREPGALLISLDGIVYPCPQLQLETASRLPVVILSKHPDHPLTTGQQLKHPEWTNCARLLDTARDQDSHGLEWMDSVKQANAWSLELTTRGGTIATFGLGDHARQLAYLETALAHVQRKGQMIANINLIPRENVPYTVVTTVGTSVPPKAIPVTESTAAPAGGNRRARDLESLLNGR